MRYWADNPELYDQIIFDEMVRQGLARPGDDPYESVVKLLDIKGGWKVAIEAEREHWASQADCVKERFKTGGENNGT